MQIWNDGEDEYGVPMDKVGASNAVYIVAFGIVIAVVLIAVLV